MSHAFRCKNCGRLHPAEHAGECELPAACVVCNYGVMFHPRTGARIAEPDNWEVLADATEERLAELGIEEEVARHTPAPPSGKPGKGRIDVSATG